jgi:hypothetical protein
MNVALFFESMCPFGGKLWKILANNLGYVCSSNFQILVHQSQIKWQHVEANFFKFKATIFLIWIFIILSCNFLNLNYIYIYNFDVNSC